MAKKVKRQKLGIEGAIPAWLREKIFRNAAGKKRPTSEINALLKEAQTYYSDNGGSWFPDSNMQQYMTMARNDTLKGDFVFSQIRANSPKLKGTDYVSYKELPPVLKQVYNETLQKGGALEANKVLWTAKRMKEANGGKWWAKDEKEVLQSLKKDNPNAVLDYARGFFTRYQQSNPPPDSTQPGSPTNPDTDSSGYEDPNAIVNDARQIAEDSKKAEETGGVSQEDIDKAREEGSVTSDGRVDTSNQEGSAGKMPTRAVDSPYDAVDLERALGEIDKRLGDARDNAERQSILSKETALLNARLNNANIDSPFGTRQVTIGPDGQTNVSVNLSPAEQAKLDASNRLAMESGETFSSLLGQYNEQLGNLKYDDTIRDSYYDKAMDYFWDRNEDRFAKDRRDREAELVAKGRMAGSRGFVDSMRDLDREQALARQEAELRAIETGSGLATQDLQNRSSLLGRISSDLGTIGQYGPSANVPQSLLGGVNGVNVATPDLLGHTSDIANAYTSGLLGVTQLGQEGARLSSENARDAQNRSDTNAWGVNNLLNSLYMQSKEFDDAQKLRMFDATQGLIEMAQNAEYQEDRDRFLSDVQKHLAEKGFEYDSATLSQQLGFQANQNAMDREFQRDMVEFGGAGSTADDFYRD